MSHERELRPDEGAAPRGTSRRRSIAAAVIVVALITAVAFMFGPRQQLSVPAVDPDLELTGTGMLFQYPDAAPHLCLGAVAESYPPQCGGPTLKGAFSWDDVMFTEASGTRWTDAAYTVQGFYDPADGEQGSFTLTRKPVPAPAVEPTPMDFPQLCSDPLRDADRTKTDEAAMTALHETLQRLPVVTLWVSDGQTAFNVRVQGDADAAFALLREVWGGELCVESSDAPTEEARVAAVNRIVEALPAGQVLYASPGSGTNTVVEVGLLVAVPEIVALVEKEAGPGIDVEVTGALMPVEG